MSARLRSIPVGTVSGTLRWMAMTTSRSISMVVA